jgi:trehalose 6-phosphate synthase
MRREELRARLGRSRRLLLGVDRLDYTKGIDIRLHAFRELLARDASLRDQCVLVQVAVPSREVVTEYRELRRRVQSLVGEINGEYSEIGRTPVQYLHRGISPIELSALYSAADVMLVTPLRDGMNLVCKEYVASRIDDSGVLVLSEFTGAAKELSTAMLVNPHDIDDLVHTMSAALRMPPAEQAMRMRPMRQAVREHDVHAWAREFFTALEQSHVA